MSILIMRSTMKAQTFLTAREAADRLGVKLDTLYAYVSRGRLRSVGLPGSRERRYRTDEVEALLGVAQSVSRGAEPEALMPVIASAICLIEDGRFYYRGSDAVTLAEGASLEDIARLLWQAADGPPSGFALPAAQASSDGLVERCQIRLAELAGA